MWAARFRLLAMWRVGVAVRVESGLDLSLPTRIDLRSERENSFAQRSSLAQRKCPQWRHEHVGCTLSLASFDGE
jgi:hypothetical protein